MKNFVEFLLLAYIIRIAVRKVLALTIALAAVLALARIVAVLQIPQYLQERANVSQSSALQAKPDPPLGSPIHLPRIDAFGRRLMAAKPAAGSETLLVVADCASCTLKKLDLRALAASPFENIVVAFTSRASEFRSLARAAPSNIRFLADPDRRLADQLNAPDIARWYVLDDNNRLLAMEKFAGQFLQTGTVGRV